MTIDALGYPDARSEQASLFLATATCTSYGCIALEHVHFLAVVSGRSIVIAARARDKTTSQRVVDFCDSVPPPPYLFQCQRQPF